VVVQSGGKQFAVVFKVKPDHRRDSIDSGQPMKVHDGRTSVTGSISRSFLVGRKGTQRNNKNFFWIDRHQRFCGSVFPGAPRARMNEGAFSRFKISSLEGRAVTQPPD
jgi:hypothetical protein